MADPQTFFQTYARALGLLSKERRAVVLLASANVTVASLFFAEPILFGRLIDVLAGAITRTGAELWHTSLLTLGAWGAVGIGGLFANFLLALNADRLAHRRRLALTVSYFEHVLALSVRVSLRQALPHRLAFARCCATDHRIVFGFWLAFFRNTPRDGD
jgi:ATP-binding cassette subfamily B protein